MVQFASTSKVKRVVAATMATTLLFSSAGCVQYKEISEKSSGSVTDNLRPDVNHQQGLLVDPALVVYNFVDSTRDIYSESSMEDSFNPGDASDDILRPPLRTESTSWNRQVDPGSFSPTSTIFVGATVYGEYLTDYFNSVVSKLEGRNDIYFRVFHQGYNKIENTSSVHEGESKSGNYKYVPATALDLQYSANPSIKSVEGLAVNDFLSDWLSNLDINRTMHDLTRSKSDFLKSLELQVSAGILSLSTRFKDVEGTDIQSKLNGSIFEMWKRNSKKCNTYRQFVEYVKSHPTISIPDLSLEYYTSWNTLSTVVLNGVAFRTKGASQTSRTPTVNLDVACLSYNQFELRQTPEVGGEKIYRDDGSIVLTYLDGYNKTVVILASKEGRPLNTTLGSKYASIVTEVTKWKAPNSMSLLTPEKYFSSSVPANVYGTN